MIKAIDMALRHIEIEMSPRILNMVFVNKGNYHSVHEGIKNLVIYHHVIPDCNLKSGKVVTIELLKEWEVHVPNEAFALFEIPASAREGREIVEVHSIKQKLWNDTVNSVDTGGAPMYGNDDIFQGVPDHMIGMVASAGAMLRSKTSIGTPNLPIPELMGNMVKLHPSPRAWVSWLLDCRIAYDREMTNLNSSAILKFADICELAVKRYCYKTLVTELDAGAIVYGSDLAAIRDLVSRWGDMKTEYYEACVAFSKATKLDIRRLESLARWAI